jgi:sugar phosphate isomerase/epimerase
MLAEIRALGFARAELSHGIRVSLVPGILKAVEDGLIEISSIHNFCPLPSFVSHAAPNLYQPSAKAERPNWLRHSLQTLEFAGRVGASHVVMHSGSVPFRFRSPAAALEAGNSPATFAAQTAALLRLRSAARRPLQHILSSYAELAPEAERRGLLLGVENREGVLELPLDAEFPAFFADVAPGPAIRYWHDTGHAQIKHRLGLLHHEQHLESLAEHLIGFHLHDVNEAGKDHQVPGSGSVDFAMVRRFVRPEHTLVLEPSPRLTRDEILRSQAYLLDLLA